MEKKVLYHIGHFGNFILAILHKYKFNRHAEAVFLIDKVLMNNIAINYISNNSGNFKKIGKLFLYNDKDIINNYSKDELSMENGIQEYFDTLLLSNNIKLDSFDEIYSTFDTFNAFGVYLTKNKKFFSMIESSKDQCQNHKRYHICIPGYPIYDDVIFKYKALSFDNEFVKKIFCYNNCSITSKPFEINCNLFSLLKDISKEDINEIIDSYKLKTNYKTKENYLFVLSSFWIVMFLKLPLQYFFYLNQLALDYYLPNKNNIVIKPHPNADFPVSKWQEYFPNMNIIPGYFPSCLIDYIEDLKIIKTLNTGSTGANTSDNKSINIPLNTFFMSYKIIDKLFFCFNLNNYLNFDFDGNCYYGIFGEVVDSLYKQLFNKSGVYKKSDLIFKEESFTIIDDLMCDKVDVTNKISESLLNSSENSVVVFFNSKNQISFDKILRENRSNFYKFIIKKEKVKENSLANIGDESFFVFCKNKEIVEKIKDFNIENNLNNVGIKEKVLFKNEKNCSFLNFNFNKNNFDKPIIKENFYKAIVTFLIDSFVSDNKTNYHFLGMSKENLCLIRETIFKPFSENNPRGINPTILKGNIFAIISNFQKENQENLNNALINSDINTKVVFWNIDHLIKIKNYYLFDYFVAISTKAKKTNENIEMSDVVFFFCKDKNIRDIVSKINIDEEIEDLGCKVEIKTDINIMNNIKIKVLNNEIENIKNK